MGVRVSGEVRRRAFGIGKMSMVVFIGETVLGGSRRTVLCV